MGFFSGLIDDVQTAKSRSAYSRCILFSTSERIEVFRSGDPRADIIPSLLAHAFGGVIARTLLTARLDGDISLSGAMRP